MADQVDDRNCGKAPWHLRRKIVLGTLGFCAVVIVGILLDGADTELNRTAMTNAFYLAGMVIASYVFGAVWNDVNMPRREARQGGAPRLPDPPPTDDRVM